MVQKFIDQKIGYSDPVVFKTSGEYSIDTAIEILKNLEADDQYRIENNGWKTKGYGTLVEEGVKVKFENVVLQIMCSYDDIFISRVSSNKNKFYEICDAIKHMDFKSA